MKKLFELHQKITFMVNEYRVIKDAQTIGYAKQKRLALREQFTIFKDESQKEVLATSKARTIIDLGPTFDVLDANSKTLGVIKKDFKKSLLSSSWSIYDPKNEKLLFHITEKNQAIAIIRRLWNLIPFANEIPFFIKFHFSILSGNKIVGEYTKLTSIKDHYALFLEESYEDKVELRVWMIAAVLLDAMQSR